jgi:DNA-binding NtrC family response regulator
LSRLLERTQGNISAAAKIAGTERRHLGRLLQKHGIRASSRAT